MGIFNSNHTISNKPTLLDNIKSKNILKLILKFANNKQLLKLVKCNNKMKKRADISLDNYIEFYKTHSPIEIELKTTTAEYDKFMNIYNQKQEIHYHVYFNNSQKEQITSRIGDNWVSKIRIKIDYPVNILAELFYCCKCIDSIKFKNLHRSNIKDMSFMCNGCLGLREIDFSNVQLENVTNMSYMFSSCESLKKINLSNLNTSNVTNMSYMFNKCKSLEYVNLSNFDTSKVKNMSYMFYMCTSLKKLNLSNFNTNNVTDFSFMFSECSDLKELDLSSFTQNKRVILTKMFCSCANLRKLNISNFGYIEDSFSKRVFDGCYSLKL